MFRFVSHSRRALHDLSQLLLFVALASACRWTQAKDVPGHPALGINLSGPADWNTELPFVDVFRLSREWISQQEGKPWGHGPHLDVDDHGWVRRLDPGCYAETPLCTIVGGHYPQGEWTVLWEGDGDVRIHGGQELSRDPGKLTVQIGKGDGFFLRIMTTNPDNPVHRIRVLMPGVTDEAAQTNPWNPSFLERWRGMACLRFMDFQATNNSTQREWSDRPLLDDATWAQQGIPVELLCDLANRLDADAWFCLPHAASDDYVRQFAMVVKDKLAAKHRAYIEYSNEVWNSQFDQHRYAADKGISLGLGAREWEAAWHYYSERSVAIFAIWEQVFGGTERLVRVLASQAASANVADEIAGWNHAWEHADVIAIAPYLPFNVAPDGKGLTAPDVSTWTVEKLLDHLREKSLPEAMSWMKANKRIANRFDRELIAYEAGQHLVGYAGAENNEALTKLLHAANAHPAMESLYTDYYRAWEEAGGGLLCHFSSVGAWNKWGSWGLLQYADEDPAASPKFRATMTWKERLVKPAAPADRKP